ncbi:AIPR family protein [Bifidobacterium sp. ESL0790]|uniref:AIPR family protein n=1 Tax=Bifidobacterium sp. ESL0790 TaxID=2983233 RepID=UPI0023F79B50|nr:AIPR family protein [Bifidobacterium sp. ESL0790]WEV71928.1 AIPR family protein [Bifidobacterium sp. ESL0790]
MSDSTEELEEFGQEFFSDVLNDAEEGNWVEDSFFDKFSDYLVDAGEFDTAERSSYQPANGQIRVDGYCGDPIENSLDGSVDGPLTLGLIILNVHQGTDLQTLSNRDMETSFRRLLRYLNSALKPEWRSSLEFSDPGAQLADLIATRWSRITKIKLYLLTNKVLSGRVDGKKAGTFNGRSVVYSVWDLKRLHAVDKSASDREPLHIDFETDGLRPLRALLASSKEADPQVYLVTVPGLDLAKIYDRWSERLLEQNVRVFLQARSNVNKGIKHTLENEPELFFAFNNGITATAEEVGTKIAPNGLLIDTLDNLQIVNGGQTTASIYSAYRAGKDLNNVFVQMKLCIVDPNKSGELVPKISEYANSQNKVSQADFFANHPFHRRMEEFSRRILAPAKEGTFHQTKWFYERARGQYNDSQAFMSRSEKKKFLAEYPKTQKFAKTDLAKYLLAWTDKVYFVNRGAQKNFAEFAKDVASEWEKNDRHFNEYFYKQVIAKKIIFNETEKIIPQMDWYEAGGYRSQHVVLTIGLIAEAARKLGKSVDFERIWNAQELDEPFRETIRKAADEVHPVLMNPGSGYRNISEWAKQQRCWEAVKSIDVEWDVDWLSELISPDEEKTRQHESTKDQKEINGIEATKAVVKAGPAFWKGVSQWLVDENEGTAKERGCVEYAAAMPKKLPSDKQSMVIVSLMQRLEKEGCPYTLSLS